MTDVKPWTLADLFARAWAQHPLASLTELIATEETAKREQAASWMAAPPTLDSSVRTDAPSSSARREGLREIEFEISVPIASGLRRQLQTAKVEAEARAKRAELDLAQLKLAGDIREAYWAARSAQRDLELAQDEVARTRLLAEDSARRTRAGESARVDTLQADSAAQLAASTAAEARGRRDAANALLSALMGRAPGDPSAVQISVTSLAPAGEKRPTQTAPSPAHATLVQAKFASEVARARLNEATRLSSEPIAAKFAVANERTDQSGSRNTARIGVSIPFDAAFRVGRFSESRATQAARELAETEAAMRVIERTVASDVRAAELALATAEARVPLAKRRAELATEAAALYEKAYRLGELDLPTRLRIEGERASALRDAARAELDVEHAISRLQQALGNLP